MKIPVYRPALSDLERSYLLKAYDSSWISSQGEFITKFEDSFRNLVNRSEALSVCNGTVAIHLALTALGIGEGDEVIVPSFTFAATINAVIYTGATPVLADVETKSFNMTAEKVEPLITDATKAIMPVHLYGTPCDLNPIQDLCKEYGLLLIEDAAEALGSKYKGISVGSFGDAATFSFYGNKTITTGEGGMVVFADKEIAEKARRLRDHGMSRERRYWHDVVGFNYRMTNMQAAIGLGQFERISEILEKKRALSEKYNQFFAAYPQIQIPLDNENYINSFWLYTIVLSEDFPSVTHLQDELLKRGIDTRRLFYPMHTMPVYQKYLRKNQKFPHSDYLAKYGLSFPSFPDLQDEEIEFITYNLSELLG
ncbi:DegT/DnrJ/EryC1/StrS family aminotransferase [Roseivirga pacifica]|uniref:DegT/DnrJ/EryC1/StrS family aminotransferase n=1 Tax=Roseivirga pacifica TaxID=1267423 RepID=UPI00227CCF17|nr:DegT/DnrJ/EryC1/StrS aminotransferase family protein [Roseivirga pacifica]